MPQRKNPVAVPLLTGGKYSARMAWPVTWKKVPWNPDRTRKVINEEVKRRKRLVKSMYLPSLSFFLLLPLSLKLFTLKFFYI